MLSMLNDKINDILDYLEFEFKNGTLKNRLVALEDKNETERLKEQVVKMNSDYFLFNSENEAIKCERKNIISND